MDYVFIALSALRFAAMVVLARHPLALEVVLTGLGVTSELLEERMRRR